MGTSGNCCLWVFSKPGITFKMSNHIIWKYLLLYMMLTFFSTIPSENPRQNNCNCNENPYELVQAIWKRVPEIIENIFIKLHAYFFNPDRERLIINNDGHFCKHF